MDKVRNRVELIVGTVTCQWFEKNTNLSLTRNDRTIHGGKGGDRVAIFIGVHQVPSGKTAADMERGWSRYKKQATKQGLQPLRVRYNLPKGVAYCETDAPSAQAVRNAHQGIDLTLDDVIEIESELT